jgi:PAS domain-containing protein
VPRQRSRERSLFGLPPLTRNAVGLCLIYLTLLGGFAFWQRQELAAVRQAAMTDAAHSSIAYDRAMRRLLDGSLGALSLAGGLGLALYLLLLRRSREVAELLEGAIAGEKVPVPQVKDDFAVAFAAADRVGQELHLARERGAQARDRLSAVSSLMDVGVLLVNSSYHLDFANPRACELLGCADAAEVERRWPTGSCESV